MVSEYSALQSTSAVFEYIPPSFTAHLFVFITIQCSSEERERMSATIYAELEIGLHRSQPGRYDVEMRLNDPSTDNEIAPARGTAEINFDDFLPLVRDPAKYGEALTGCVFSGADVRALYGKAKAVLDRSDRPLRLRLLIGPSASELHSLRWELLQDPETNLPFASSERVLFSRFMLSRDWRAVKLRARTDLKAVVAVSAPTDLAKYNLADVPLDGEIKRASAALTGIAVSVIGKDKPCTLDALVEAMRSGPDVVYLVCHGMLAKNSEPYLFLQNEAGITDRVNGSDLAARIAELPQPPRLMVLASCESAGVDDGKHAVQSALAPRLADAGVPAVLAMQGKISMQTVEIAMPVFFRELLVDGQIDRAMAVARRKILKQSDAWMPALFLRLRGGRIWYVPGFASSKSEFEQWKSICRFVRNGEFVPVIGSDVTSHIFGTPAELAFELATESGFPLSMYDRADPAKVAQFISTKTGPKDLRNSVKDALMKRMRRKAKELGIPNSVSAQDILGNIVEALYQDENDPCRILSDLNAKVYVTANANSVLEMMLKRAGKVPADLVSQWRDERRDPRAEPAFQGEPTNTKPLIYYVYGRMTKEETWILTEDDFFDYLIRTSKYDLMPLVISDALTTNSLLFLGFALDDWKFRILFRIIMAKGGSSHLEGYNHVGVQLDPDEHTAADAVRAKTYLERYFNKAEIDIYWGSTAEFLRELRDRLKSFQEEEHAEAAAAGGW